MSKEILTKGEMKRKLIFLLLDEYPERTIQDALWDKIYHYYLGYSHCFSAIVSDRFPLDNSYAKNFILEETYNYLIECS